MSYPAAHASVPSDGRGIPWRILLGAALILSGLVLLVVAVSLRDDSPLFLVGGVLLGAGSLRLTTALARDARRHRRELADPDDPRWRDGVTPMQLAGRLCVECGEKIIIGAEATACEQCALPAHLDCKGGHQTRAHGVVRFDRPGSA